MFPLKNFRIDFKHFLVVLGLSGFILSTQMPAFALAVPEGVRQWVLEQDKLADIREDGWVKLSTGDEYILVQPAEIPMTSDTVKVTNITHIGGDETSQPDVVMFSNGYFLLHVIPLAGGEKTLPILENASSLLKSAHLPESFHVPKNLYIPNDWKPLLLPDIQFDPSEPNTAASTDDKNTFYWVSGDSLFLTQPANSAAAGAYGTGVKSIQLPCEPLARHGVIALSASQEYLLTCVSKPQAYHISIDPKAMAVTALDTVSLPSLASDVAYNTTTAQAYFAHPNYTLPQKESLKAPESSGWFHFNKAKNSEPSKVSTDTPSLVSIYSLSKHQILEGLKTVEPVKRLYYSSFRQQLYLLSSSRQNLFVVSMSNPKAPVQKLSFQQPIRDWAVQYDKLLWLLTDSNAIEAFDMRWQELTLVEQLSSPATALEADSRWLYVLQPSERILRRYSAAQISVPQGDKIAVLPIQLSADCEASHMWLSPSEDKLFLSEVLCKRLGVVDLSAARLLETTVIDPVTEHPEGMVVSAQAKVDNSSQRARIRFQDARMLIRNAPVRQQVTLPTSAHDQTEAPSQPE